MEKDYANCQHEWKVDSSFLPIPVTRCKKCELSIEVYQDHVSVWDYSLMKEDDPWIGKLFYNKIEA